MEFVTSEGRRRNSRWAQRRVRRYVVPGRTLRGAVMGTGQSNRRAEQDRAAAQRSWGDIGASGSGTTVREADPSAEARNSRSATRELSVRYSRSAARRSATRRYSTTTDPNIT